MVMVQVVITTEWYVINMPLQVKIFLTVPKNISSVQKMFHAVTAAGDDHAAVPRVRRGQGDLPAAARVPLPAARPHLPLRHVRVQVNISK